MEITFLSILVLLATIMTSTQALNCYYCWAWAGTEAHNEACRSNGVASVVCTFENTYDIDSATNALTGRTLADLDIPDEFRERALASAYCFKLGGISTTGTATVVRGCVSFSDNTERNGNCETNKHRQNFTGGTIAPGSYMWTSSANNGNGGTAITCSSGNGNPGGVVTNSGVAVNTMGALFCTVAAALAAFKR